MKILAHVHGYPPVHNAGAEIMLHALLKEMTQRGHKTAVLVPKPGVGEYEGVKLYSSVGDLEKAYSRADLVITQLDTTRMVLNQCNKLRKPLVHLVHNDKQLSYWKVAEDTTCPTLVVFNSKWLYNLVPWNGEKIVVIPPVNIEDYETEVTGNKITLINLNSAKGSGVFWDLVKMFPDKKFLAVKGSYGFQMIPDFLPRNVEVMEQIPNCDMRKVYAKTRILLMPSHYESWGRVAVEAACSGIPTIANPTPGLQEALGKAGVYASWQNINEWILALNEVDSIRYPRYSENSRKRVEELNPKPYYDLFEESLLKLAGGR